MFQASACVTPCCSAKSVFLVVEGATEERALLILFRKITGESLASAGVTLINTGGAGSVRRLVEVLIKQLKRNVVVLVDEDARNTPGRINEDWLSSMQLVEGTNGFFIGTKEFEDSFEDDLWLRVAKEHFSPADGTEWVLSDLTEARNAENGMGQALENLFSRRQRTRVSKPQVGEALALTIPDEKIPEVIRSVVSATLAISKNGEVQHG